MTARRSRTAPQMTMALHADAPREADRPFPELLRELGDELTTLVRDEIALAKVEIVEKSRDVGKAAPMFGAGALFGLGAFIAFTVCLIALIALAMPTWAAALIVTILYGAVAAVAALNGKKKLQAAAPPVPTQTVQTVKDDIEWAKTRAKSGRT